MFYAFHYDVQATDLVTNKHRIDMTLTAGIIHQVDILFENGCNYDVAIQIFKGATQLFPTNPGESFRGNATVISFREFLEIKGAVNEFHADVWTEDTANTGMIVIQFGILARDIIQPLSFKELVKAATAIP